jgi:hypothetical protein
MVDRGGEEQIAAAFLPEGADLLERDLAVRSAAGLTCRTSWPARRSSSIMWT